MNTLLSDSLETPVGTLFYAAAENGGLRWMGFSPSLVAAKRARDPHGYTTAMQRYFDGEVTAIDELAADGEGTEFQRRVWQALREIPVGETESYGHLAARIGRPNASRAVGMANHCNPIGIVVPCHRVVGSGGALTGYAAGLDRKRWLLAHEARHAPAAAGPLFRSVGSDVVARAARRQVVVGGHERRHRG